MSRRLNKLYRKVDSTEVQGEGSWVLLKAPSFDEIRNGAMGDQTSYTEQIEFSINIIGNLVIDWNWVDDEDNPLPEPSPGVIRALPFQEINFLMKALELENLSNQKN